jgi:hypothetical protein
VPISFQQDKSSYVGTGAGGREWRVTPTLTGWRLQFRDTGDSTATNAGVFADIEAAKTEANRVVSQTRRR